jgi:hypothetical protein
MASEPRAKRPAAGTGAAVVAAVALAAVVAASAGDVPAWLAVGPVRPSRFQTLLFALAVTAVAMLTAAALAIVSRRRRAGTDESSPANAARSSETTHAGSTTNAAAPAPPPLRATLGRALPVAVAVAAAVVLVLLARFQEGAIRASGPATPEAYATETDRRAQPFGFMDDRATPVVEGAGEVAVVPPEGAMAELFPPALLLLLGALAVALAAGIVLWRYRAARWGQREAPGELRAGAEHEAAHGAVMGSIDAMLADADPRTAIIGAYARLLEGLAACGLARLDHEAPMEHLARVLQRLSVRREPLRRLLQLFQRARFSTHALDATHRGAALAALQDVAGDLAAFTTAAASAGGGPSAGGTSSAKPASPARQHARPPRAAGGGR